jgi:hypothetical protein
MRLAEFEFYVFDKVDQYFIRLGYVFEKLVLDSIRQA